MFALLPCDFGTGKEWERTMKGFGIVFGVLAIVLAAFGARADDAPCHHRKYQNPWGQGSWAREGQPGIWSWSL